MWNSRHLELTSSWKHQNEIMESHIEGIAVVGGVLQILEAGCGQRWLLNLDGVQYVLTGVDLDKAALEIRKNVVKDLHEAIEGDLISVRLQENHYDVIYCSYVLEHIQGAEQVLSKFVNWIKPNGIIILLIPDSNSVQGFISRVTPHWFHVFHYRFILGNQNAGKAGYAPYPVHYDRVISRNGIRDFCSRNNLTVLAEYGDGFNKPGKDIVRLLIHSFKQVVGALSFGLLSGKHNNLLYILQKPQLPNPAPQRNGNLSQGN